jgi:ubiquinone/menaquinone biosynthesis C-methylase UbiE
MEGSLSLPIEILYCPECYSDLKQEGEKWSCSGCQFKSENINGIPWLIKNPQSTRIDWVNRFNSHMQRLYDQAVDSKHFAGQKDLMKLTKERLTQMGEAYVFQYQTLEKLLKPLGVQSHDNPAINDLTHSVLPAKQQAETYWDNLFRDWSWETDENKKHSDLVKNIFQPSEGATVAVLGSGSSRLAFDLHSAWNGVTTLAIDFNPLLFLAAKEMVEGKEIELFEFPLSPRDKSQHMIKQTLKAPSPNNTEDFYFLFADGTRPPLKDNSLDVVVTPWFLDILPQDADLVIREINRVLKPGGRWIYFGSYYFNSANPRLAYSKEELLHLISKDGFQVNKTEEMEVPYMQSPSSCQKRIENVLVFEAEKTKEVECFEFDDFRPPWIQDPDKAIPNQEAFASQAFINQLHFQVLTQVDGEKNLNDIAEFISTTYKLPKEEALESVRSFFIRLIEKGLFKA